MADHRRRLPARPLRGHGGRRRREETGAWSNWAGTERAAPAAVAYPVSLEEVVEAVKAAADAGLRAKAVGSGHSFTGAAVTDGVAIHLDDHCRLLDVDPVSGVVTTEAGVTLARLDEHLAGAGLALANVGDIDAQSLGGALATGTHGTGAGAGAGGLATQVVGLEIVTADGSVHSCTPAVEPDLFEAARVGLGALGIVTTVTLQAVPAFNLHAVEDVEPLSRVLSGLDRTVATNDHFELFWVPHTGLARTKRNNRTSEGPRNAGGLRRLAHRELVENAAFGAVCRVERRWPSLTPRLARLLATGGRSDYVDRSYRVFASPRRVRFVEMEYALPRPAVAEALDRIARLIATERLTVAFPVEVRFAPADDVWMSTANGRDSAYIAVHQYRGMPYERYFALVEEVMVDCGGRPHWGKLHGRTGVDLAGTYPDWARWQAVRARVDPGGMWSNPYLDRVLGPRA